MPGVPTSAVLVVIPLLPFLFRYAILFLLRCCGWYLQAASRHSRDSVLTTVKSHIQTSQPSQPSKPPEDEDWEKVEADGGKTNAPRAGSEHADWDGVFGFFHPFCAAGGGGERVLWAAVRATQQRWPRATCVIYSGDGEVNAATMLAKAQSSFGISLNSTTIHFVYLRSRSLVLASTYPYFTLLGQSLGSVLLAWEALSLFTPDIFIDTMGYAFALAFSKYVLPNVPTAAYVHYPTISTDMLDSLDDQTSTKGVNAGAGSGWRGVAKKVYWRLFAGLYGWVGSHIELVMCNSSWTRGHILALWKSNPREPNTQFAAVLYPPCPVAEFSSKIRVDTSSESTREPLILYVAQFRHEKNHSLVLRSFAKYFRSLPANDQQQAQSTPKLVLIGSVRQNSPDEKHIYTLRLEARELGINEHTIFVTDAPFSLVLSYLQRASIGVNGMWNEHFGIGVVEYLAAGLIPVVHDSGGPKMDIVVPYHPQDQEGGGGVTGFHAETEEEFAEGYRKVMGLGGEERLAMRLRGRESAKRFGEEVFASKWVEQMTPLVDKRAAKIKRWLK